MQSPNVVVLQNDSAVAESLLNSLKASFRYVQSTRSLSDLRAWIARNRAEVVVLDMEAASLAEISQLSHEFPKARIVCTHRIADEQMWTAALNAGAADVCPSSDTRGILSAVMRVRAAAAA
ncbi:MAG TPA: hypothetical protein VH437_00180 [Terriglobales bacterium]|jgi:DNA-binding NarL/FixJ family response regulator